MERLNILVFGIFIFILTTVQDGLASTVTVPKSDSALNITNTNIEETFIEAYHFHTYFYQWEEGSQGEALDLRDKIQREINRGTLKGCRNNFVNFAPRGPHLIANYETCCNATAMPAAMSFFMQNHGNLSVLFHPLTRWELLDHTDRAMFLGPVVRMDTGILSIDLFDDVDNCSEDEMEFPDPNLFIT